MSALGYKRTFRSAIGMSALPPKADMCGATRDVRFVPIADISGFIRSPRRRERRKGGQAECFCGLQTNYERDFRGLLNCQRAASGHAEAAPPRNEIEEIGNGTHERMVVDITRLARGLRGRSGPSFT